MRVGGRHYKIITPRMFRLSASAQSPTPLERRVFLCMFHFTNFARCFSRSVFLRYGANAATTTGLFRYSLPILRKMASASGDGEDAKPKHTNRLQHSKSPYLLQHKHNPVDWLVLNRKVYEVL